MTARDVIDVATDIACGVGNKFGGHVYAGTDRDTIEFGIRRLTAAGYRLIGPGELDRETIERCAAFVADVPSDLPRHKLSAALRSLEAASRPLPLQETEK